MKQCTLCKQEKEESDFNKKRGRKDGLQTKCKECSRRASKEHYLKNKERYLQRNQNAVQELRKLVDELKNNPCTDCGNRFPPCAMDFDHLEGTTKYKEVSVLAGTGFGRHKVLEEIAKCELVCANCHRIRTDRRRHTGIVQSAGHETLTLGTYGSNPAPGTKPRIFTDLRVAH